MPYIDKGRRLDLDDLEAPAIITTPGELNYKITKLCTDYLDIEGTDYNALNAIIGVLECAKQEFYRRVTVPYENRKCKQNGDVYPDV